jgi:hypothetical protein
VLPLLPFARLNKCSKTHTHQVEELVSLMENSNDSSHPTVKWLNFYFPCIVRFIYIYIPYAIYAYMYSVFTNIIYYILKD